VNKTAASAAQFDAFCFTLQQVQL